MRTLLVLCVLALIAGVLTLAWAARESDRSPTGAMGLLPFVALGAILCVTGVIGLFAWVAL